MRKMTRIWITVAAMAVCLGGFQTGLWAATLTADPVFYEITLHQVRVYNQDDGTWHVAGTGDISFDIASAASGAAVGNYISGVSLAEGTYSKFEATLSRTFHIKAVVFDAGGVLGGNSNTYYYTSAVTASGAIVCIKDEFPYAVPAGYAQGTAVIPSGTTLPATETIDGDYLIHTETLATNIIVRAGETRTVRVSFDITNSATFEGVAGPAVICYPSAPAITITQID